MMAEKKRTRILNALKAVFTPNNKNEKQFDYSPFVFTMKRLSER